VSTEFDSPLWRFFVTNLAGEGITDFSKLAADRSVTVVLNGPLTLEGRVPSDNVQVFTTDVNDGDPFLAEGTRLLWGFRRESTTPPYYVCRAATICQLVEDTAEQDDGRTSFTGYDPWQYLFSRPVCNFDGSLPGTNGISWTATQASVVVAQLLRNTIVNHGHAYVDAGMSYGGTFNYDGTLETGAGMVIDINFQQGTSVGEAWQQIAAMNVCDIVLEPIYRPGPPSSSDQANYLCQLNVYAQAGSVRDEAIFAWNLPGRSLVQISRMQEGNTRRANNVKFFAGQGGSASGGQTIAVQTDATSEAKYGEYWAQQFFPGETVAASVLSMAERQLELRKNGRETVTFRPAPERSPRPWLDYELGDRVVVWASKEGFRQLLGQQTVGTVTSTQYQRVYGWRTNISDDALETVDPLMVSQQGFTA
jgi:hypothetical protein